MYWNNGNDQLQVLVIPQLICYQTLSTTTLMVSNKGSMHYSMHSDKVTFSRLMLFAYDRTSPGKSLDEMCVVAFRMCEKQRNL